MPANDPIELRKIRRQIASSVTSLRKQRRWTQAELGRRIGLSQGHVSNIERGAGSFTAEQLVLLLKLFNTGVERLVNETVSDSELELQNALVRFGANHLYESEHVLPSPHLADVHVLILEVLAREAPRLVTALAPVLVRHVDRISLRKLHADAQARGLEHRLAWVVENTLLATSDELAEPLSKTWRSRYRRATLLLHEFLTFALSKEAAKAHPDIVDILDPEIRTRKTVEELRKNASHASRRWGIVTRLNPNDFSKALRAARDED